jgi:hypothetical protein
MNKMMMRSEVDRELLSAIDDRANTLRTRIRSVADGDTYGLFIFGPGGMGKSYIVEGELNTNPGFNRWKTYKGDISARGLIDALEKYPNAVHVLEDMEKAFKKEELQSVLRAALASVKRADRHITDNKHKRNINFLFHGGIIILSNDQIDSSYGRLGAIASRTDPLFWKLSDPELAAMMRCIALNGYGPNKEISPKECLEVAEYVIDQMDRRQATTKVDLRTFCDGALPDYRQWIEGRSHTHWKKVVESRIQGEPIGENRKDRLDRQRQLACEIYSHGKNQPEQLELWKRETGLGRQAFYDRLGEARRGGLLDQNENRRGKSDKRINGQPTQQPTQLDPGLRPMQPSEQAQYQLSDKEESLQPCIRVDCSNDEFIES